MLSSRVFDISSISLFDFDFFIIIFQQRTNEINNVGKFNSSDKIIPYTNYFAVINVEINT